MWNRLLLQGTNNNSFNVYCHTYFVEGQELKYEITTYNTVTQTVLVLHRECVFDFYYFRMATETVLLFFLKRAIQANTACCAYV